MKPREASPEQPAPAATPGFFASLLRQTSIYALGNVILKASGLVLAPLYLNLLTETAYGHLALLDATARVVVLLGGLGVATGLLRFMTSSAHADTHDALPFTALVTSAGMAVLVLALVWGLAPVLASTLLDDAGAAWLIRLMGVYGAFKMIEAIPIMLLRTKERAGLYVTATVAELLVLMGGVGLLLGVMRRGLLGVMEAYAISAGVGTVVLTAGMLMHVSWRFRLSLVRRLIRFGAPLVLAAAASLFMNIGDRYLLKLLADARTVGIYDWAGRLGGVLNLFFVQSFQLAFGVLGLKSLGLEPGGERVYRRVFRHYVIWTGWGVLGLALLSLDVTRLVSARPAYQAADVLVLPVALGFLAYGLYYIVVNVLYATDRTRSIAWMVGAAALSNAGLNLMLIPWMGALGAALSTTAAYGILLALTVVAAERQIRVRYPWGTLALVLGLVLGLYLLGRPAADWSTWARLGWRGLLILAYPVLIVALRLYTPAELRQGWKRVRALFG